MSAAHMPPTPRSGKGQAQPSTTRLPWIEKCRFCWYEGEPGNPPACVGTCISGARVFGDLDDPESDISREIARTNAQPIAGDLTESKIYYVR